MATPEPIRDPILERALPSSPDTERAILGAIILDNTLIAQAVELLKARRLLCSLAPPHLCGDDRAVSNADRNQSDSRGGRIAPRQLARSSGGVLFLTNLTNGLPHVTSVVQFAKVVRGKSLLRQLVKVATRSPAKRSKKKTSRKTFSITQSTQSSRWLMKEFARALSTSNTRLSGSWKKPRQSNIAISWSPVSPPASAVSTLNFGAAKTGSGGDCGAALDG
jgi:hypothetical protein